ncbi:putative zinc-binding metallopeptidase, partial [Segatella buccae]
VTNTSAQWDKWIKEAGTTGGPLITSKLDIVREYMKNQWNIDIDRLRDAVLQREDDVVSGKVDVSSNLTVK